MVTSMLGAFGSGGICLVISLWLVLGNRKTRHRLAQRHKDHHNVWWAIAIGLVASGAGQMWSMPDQIGAAIDQTFTSGAAAVGNVGVAAVAVIITMVLFCTEPKLVKDIVLGSALPSIYAAAGGIWALAATTAGSFLHGLVGA